jgi:hypothetical protein
MILLRIVACLLAFHPHSYILPQSRWRTVADMKQSTAVIWINQLKPLVSPGHDQPSPYGSRLLPVNIGAMQEPHGPGETKG